MGDWTPLNPRDAGGVDNAAAAGCGNPPEHILGCKSIAIQKSVANLTDSVNSPGDVLEYTLRLSGAVTPILTASAANNTIRFDYGDYDNPNSPASVVDLLFAVAVRGIPLPMAST